MVKSKEISFEVTRANVFMLKMCLNNEYKYRTLHEGVIR